MDKNLSTTKKLQGDAFIAFVEQKIANTNNLTQAPKIKKSPMYDALNQQYIKLTQNLSKYPIESQWIAPKNAKGVKYVSFLGSTGYADAAKGYVRSLAESGTYVFFEAVRCHGGKSNDLLSNDDLILSISINNSHILYDSVIIHTVPRYWKQIVDLERSVNPNVKIYGLTVWETDRVHPQWMTLIDELKLSGLIVPSNWNKKTFEQSAKDQGILHFLPIHTCHHVLTDSNGIISPSLTRQSLYGDVKTAFLCVGTWTPRKGIDETIDTYLKAFENQKDVVLYLKTNSGSSKQADLELHQRLQKILMEYKSPPKIILDTELRSNDYIEALTKNCDVFLSLCNSEGVGLGACAAALKGKIIVMTGYGGQVEYIEKASWIDFKLDVVQVPSDFADWVRPPQKWAYPNIKHAIDILKNVHNNIKKYQKEAEMNRSIMINKFSYQTIGKRLLSIISTSGKNNQINTHNRTIIQDSSKKNTKIKDIFQNESEKSVEIPISKKNEVSIFETNKHDKNKTHKEKNQKEKNYREKKITSNDIIELTQHTHVNDMNQSNNLPVSEHNKKEKKSKQKKSKEKNRKHKNKEKKSLDKKEDIKHEFINDRDKYENIYDNKSRSFIQENQRKNRSRSVSKFRSKSKNQCKSLHSVEKKSQKKKDEIRQHKFKDVNKYHNIIKKITSFKFNSDSLDTQISDTDSSESFSSDSSQSSAKYSKKHRDHSKKHQKNFISNHHHNCPCHCHKH